MYIFCLFVLYFMLVDLEVFYLGHLKNLYTIQYNTIQYNTTPPTPRQFKHWDYLTSTRVKFNKINKVNTKDNWNYYI